MLRARHIALLTVAATTACGARAPAPVRPVADPATTGAITGVVRDQATGAALSFATVVAAAPASEQPPEHTDTSDADGAFRIEGLAPGTYRVTVYYGSVSARWQDVQIEAGKREQLAIALSLTDAREATAMPTADARDPTRVTDRASGSRGSIAGEVLDQATGEKLEGAVVAVTVSSLRDAQMAVTNADGEYLISGLPPGTYKLSCYYRLIDYGDIEVQRTAIEVAPGETTRVPLLLDTSVTAVPD